ncbi:hypothetical protein POTOM_033706 [Populus tomentosa]|uniref:Apyrase 6 n=1 Tax=Populus tomentosa TaxID=118781 RepID=A0A8X7Z2J0_POPTO|nr:hypothetical protein POTOM_033706 [Populus tomentosa]
MDFSALQSRPFTASYFPLHRTQLHPRMHSLASPYPPQQQSTKSQKARKFLILLATLFTIPFLFYIFSTAQRTHRSSKFANPNTRFFSVVIDSGRGRCRVRVYQLLGEGNVGFSNGQLPLITGSMKVRPGLGGFVEDPDSAGGLIEGLVEFAKKWVPRREWGNAGVQLMVSGKEMVGLEGKVKERILEVCRKVLRASGFAFKDEWARVIEEEERGVYSWVAVNYVHGSLGNEADKTTGIVELDGNSLQITFASREVAQVQSSRRIKLARVTYNLQAQSLPKFGQDAAWESLHDRHSSRDVSSSSIDREDFVGNPCIPQGHELASNISGPKLLMSHGTGNFTACRLEVRALLKSRQEKCLRPPCNIDSPFFMRLQGKPVSQDNLFFASEFFGLVPRVSLFELEAAGKHYCEDDWDKLKDQHHGIDDLDLLRYCFSSAYTVALLHDSLGISMNDKRIGFANHTGSVPFDWTLGAFIFQSMLEPLESEINYPDEIVGNESVTYFSLFAILLIALLAAFFVLQLRKPQLKTIYDLEKGRYIVTRLPR